MVQGHPSVIHTDSRTAILAVHLSQRFQENSAEVIHSLIAPAELILEGFPRDKLRFAKFDTVKALRKPCVNIKRHC